MAQEETAQYELEGLAALARHVGRTITARPGGAAGGAAAEAVSEAEAWVKLVGALVGFTVPSSLVGNGVGAAEGEKVGAADGDSVGAEEGVAFVLEALL